MGYRSTVIIGLDAPTKEKMEQTVYTYTNHLKEVITQPILEHLGFEFIKETHKISIYKTEDIKFYPSYKDISLLTSIISDGNEENEDVFCVAMGEDGAMDHDQFIGEWWNFVQSEAYINIL